MSSKYLVSNFICALCNAGKSKKEILKFEHSKVVEGICSILNSEGYISGYEVVSSEKHKHIKEMHVKLKYHRNNHAIAKFRTVSKPGKRQYWNLKKLKHSSYYDGFGYYILSTNSGIVSDRTAKELGIGGEVLCSVF